MDDILLSSSDLGLLHEIKKYLTKNFEMVDTGKAFYIIGIEIFTDRPRGLLGLSHKGYINRVLERFNMQLCSVSDAPIMKGFNERQYPKNDLEREQIQKILYASSVESLTYAQTCTKPDISFAMRMLGIYQSNSGMEHWKEGSKEGYKVSSRDKGLHTHI